LQARRFEWGKEEEGTRVRRFEGAEENKKRDSAAVQRRFSRSRIVQV
jgi:hypothetical protein